MRALIQRVQQAKVEVFGECIGSIDAGMLVLFGIHKDDSPITTKWMVDKIVGLRIFADEHNKMNKSVKDIGGGILVVSQFTLYANCSSGRRPDFFEAASGPFAESIYDKFIKEMKESMPKVQTGRFGAAMQVHLVNDGPVTILLERE